MIAARPDPDPPPARERDSNSPSHYLRACAYIAVTTALATVAHRAFALPDVAMLYLLAVMLTAISAGRGPSLFAAALSVVVYDFFFVPPYLTFAVAEGRYLLTFAMMFAVGILPSRLTERLRRQEAEVRAREMRAQTEELRSTLLSSVSHDLRTPLAAITGAATTLRDTPGLSAEASSDMLATIIEDAERLERLVSNLLEMTRLDSGSVRAKREWVPLEEVVGGALGRLERELARREVEVSLPAGVSLVSVDPLLFEQLLHNLLDNAIRYTPEGSELSIRARLTDETLVVEVADRGPGVTRGDEDRVFERFYRGTHAGVSGAGLGLSICRGIAQAHAGTLVAEQREGGGAVFRVSVPMEGAAPTDTPVAS